MKRYLFFCVLIVIFSCKKYKEGEVLPNGYYDCILTHTFTFDSSSYTYTDNFILKKVRSNSLEEIDFTYQVNSFIENSTMTVDENKNIIPGTLWLSDLYYPTGYWYYDKESKTYYIKGAFINPNQNSETGTFVISKEVE